MHISLFGPPRITNWTQAFFTTELKDIQASLQASVKETLDPGRSVARLTRVEEAEESRVDKIVVTGSSGE